MNYLDFDPYLTHQRNEEVLREVHSLRLENRLRGNAGPRGSRLIALIKSSALLLREVGSRGDPATRTKQGGVGR
jgi:hypothetical protein